MTDPNLPQGVRAPASAVAEPRERRSRARVWIIVVVAALVLGAAYVATFLFASVAFDNAYRVHTDSAAAMHITEQELAAAMDRAPAIADASRDIAEVATDEVVTTTARTSYETATEEFAAAVDAGEILAADAAATTPAPRPTWPWELWATADALTAAARDLDQRAAAMRDASAELQTAREALVAAGTALFESVLVATEGLDAQNVSALGWSVVDFRTLRDRVAEADPLGRGAARTFENFVDSITVMKNSHTAELAQKAGPLLDRRLAVEEYARSISGGVLLDFDWAELVNGIGGSTGISGTATWTIRGDGFSTITLSDSVAEIWPDPAAMGLVTHEVGHAITAKCSDKYDTEDPATIEAWATAWAMSMGHAAENSGADLYGYPSQELIAAAATCR